MELVEGGTLAFTVVAKNKHGTVVPVTDATVELSDPALGSVTVNADGTGGIFTAATGVAGDEMLTPSAGGVTGTGFPVTVASDLSVASVEIVVDAPATVEIVPTV